jgi:ribosome biogenesis GTPase
MDQTAARVCNSARGVYRLDTAAGEVLARLSGKLKFRTQSPADLPVTGDYVESRLIGSEAVIDMVLPRRTKLSRRAAGTREDEQVLAANVDTVFIVTGLDGDYSPRRIERYLVLVRESGARPVVVLNKADLCGEDLGRRLDEVRLVASGALVIATSTTAPGGLSELEALVKAGDTVVFVGSSGAGKSTIINHLAGAEVRPTQEVRSSDSRGRHTTTQRELLKLASGAFVIDTPGLREIQLWASEASVVETFADVRELAASCRFNDCSHGGEPGCAVAAALDSGALDAGRWHSFQRLSVEVTRREVLLDEHGRVVEKRALKRIHKAMRKFRERED